MSSPPPRPDYFSVDFAQTPFVVAWETTRACALACSRAYQICAHEQCDSSASDANKECLIEQCQGDYQDCLAACS